MQTGNSCQVPELPFARYRLRFVSRDKGLLHGYTGSVWRGALGHALKKVVCVTRHSACMSCLVYRSCPYPYIFETPPPPGAQKMRKYTAAPHPFLIEPPAGPEGDAYDLGLTLIGRGNGYLSYLIHALQRAGEQGLGKGRISVELTGVWQALPAESERWKQIYEPGGILEAGPPDVAVVPAAPDMVRITFETPTRLQRDAHLVTPRRFRFSDLFGPLLRRVSMLSAFHTDTPLETDFAGLMERARRVEAVGAKLVWKDWTRYSSRQRTTMQMGGLIGEIVVDLTEGFQLWPYLWLGQWLHVGKGTSMGLGRYTIGAASLPSRLNVTT
ncbi:MAG: CRISPR system precrRNA processing endoribonuclease RAMP protein Cas6 [Acidobacteria bacterium]|nr:CRISPR system precrRNA processing endoribonuclease RAMP protein Cas6 [Bacillota bacterium]NLT68229.1 CRISPR system precrRNA processing endoribonuclease RAMP protein Cas6 [Acidobacteriota bacterium]